MKPRHFAVGIVIFGLVGLVYAASIPLKRSGRTWDCQANLKHIGLSMSQYNRDYDERYPRAQDWMHALKPYFTRSSRTVESAGFQQLARCPATQGHYALNIYYDRLSMWQDVTPPSSPLIFDIRNGQLNQTDNGANWPVSPVHTTLQTIGSNVLFADGHVELRQNKPRFRKFPDRLTPNGDGTPTPRVENKQKP